MESLLLNFSALNAAKAGVFLLVAHMFHIGLWAYISPRGLCKFSGLRHDGRVFSSITTSSNAKSARATQNTESENANFWPYLFAPREVGFGLSLLILSALGEWKAVGVIVGIVGGLLATTDGWVAGIYGKGGWTEVSYSHALPGIVLGWMSYTLLKE